jgi:hypothetical protein
VDLLLTGHDHNYQRCRPILHRYEPGHKHPYVQIVTGGGGAPKYEDLRATDLWFGHAAAVNHYVRIRIDGDKLIGEAIDLQGQVFDTFHIYKQQPARDAVAFELIELERVYQSLAAAAGPGQSSGPILLEPDQQAGTLAYVLPNPLPEPITVTYQPPHSAGLEIAEASKSIVEIRPGETNTATFAFRVTDTSRLLPIDGPKVSLSTPVGARDVQAAPPAVAYRRVFAAPPAESGVAVDGKGDETCWQTASAVHDFTQARGGQPVWPTQVIQSDVRLLHDASNLFILVESVWPLSKFPQRGQHVEDSDHVSVFLGGSEAHVLLRVDTDGRFMIETEPHLDAPAVRSAARFDGVRATWELAIPLVAISTDAAFRQPLAFNVQQRRGRDDYDLSPTLGLPISRASAGYLKLE